MKTIPFLRSILAVFLSLVFAQAGWGQTLFDSFTDGNFTASPTWGGNTTAWGIQSNSDAAAGATGSNTLRLASTGGATVYLSSQVSSWGTSQEWGVWIGRRAQAFTAANQAYFWLFANESNVTSATVDGYRLAIGDDSGVDNIRLEYIVNGAVSATVITSTGGSTNGVTDIGFLVRVTRSSSGAWALFTSTLPTANATGAIASAVPNSTNASVSQGSATNNSLAPTANNFLGVAALHSTGANALAAVEFDQIYFSTASSPTVTTGTSGSITSTGAIVSGNDVTADGGSTITERGVVFGTSENPTTANGKATTSGTTGAYDTTITGLLGGTLYHARAFATNGAGTSYGAGITFTTSPVAPSVTTGDATPAEFGTLVVTQLANNNNTIAISPPGISLAYGAGKSPRGVFPTTSNRGDYGMDFGFANDVATGMLIPSIAQLGRDDTATGGTEDAIIGTFYATSSILIDSSSYVMAIHASPRGDEANYNTSYAYLPYTEFVGGIAQNSVNNGEMTSVTGSSGLVLNTHFTDLSDTLLPGQYTLNLNSFTSGSLTLPSNASQNGILLVTGAKNEDNYALSRANADGSFTLFCHDNGIDGATYENDPVGFSYLPVSAVGRNRLVAMGRINGNASADLSGGTYTVTSGGNGQWYLTIPNHSQSTGTLIVSPEGGDGNNVDNIVASAWDSANNRWIIESRDLTGVGLQNTGGTVDIFSFAFFSMPDATHSSLTRTSAKTTGTITADGNSAVTERGVVFSTSPNPSIDDMGDIKVVVAGTTGNFPASLTGLVPGTLYYYRAYATNAIGTAYGSEFSFSTQNNNLPTFSAMSVSTVMGSPVDILRSKILARTSDADGDTISISGVTTASAQAGTVSLGATAITYTPAANFSGIDTIAFTLNDGFGSIQHTITVTVAADPLFTSVSNAPRLTDLGGGAKRIAFNGIPGRTYAIQRSTTLEAGSWTQIAAVTAAPDSTVTYDDPTPPQPSAFYRIAFPAAAGQ